MQSQSSSSTAPAHTPEVSVQKPAIVERPAAKPRGRGPWWIVGLILIAAVAAGVLYWQKKSAANNQAEAASRAVRTAKAFTGGLNASIRLTGATSAENFVSLMVPQLRGSRSGYGRDRPSVQTASTVPTLSLSSGSGTSSSPSAGSSGSSNSSAANMSGALKSSTSRFGGGPRSPAGATSSTTARSSSASSALGADGTGSTASALPPNGGGGGGGNDFMLVLQKMVKPGSHVKKGEVVAEFDRQYMMNRLDDYRASVIQAEAALHKLKADLTITRQAHKQSIEKAKGLLGKTDLDLKTIPVLSAIDAERAKLAKQDAEARYKELLSEVKLVETSLNSQIRNAEIDMQQTKLELKRAEANADRMIVKTPIAGLTVMQSIPRGGEIAQVQEGDQLYPGITFISIVDPSSMVVNATVNQSDVERLRIGAKAKVRFDAYPDLELPARVYSVGGIAKQGGQRASFVKEIPVRLKLERTDPRVIPDLSVSADVIIESEPQQTAVVPLSAVFRDAPSRTPYVYVQRPEGWTRREVQLGVISFTAAAVRSGINANDVVAVERPSDGNQKASAQ